VVLVVILQAEVVVVLEQFQQAEHNRQVEVKVLVLVQVETHLLTVQQVLVEWLEVVTLLLM
jgi:hypothetical protein